MRWEFTPYSYLLVVVAAISATLVFYAWRRRGTPGAETLALLMAGVCVWAAGYALELSGADLPTKIFWAKVEYLGIVTVPLAWLAFALQYTGREGWLTYRNLALLSALPLITLLLTWTNEEHYLVWTSTILEASGPFLALNLAHGAWFWVHWSYSYLLLLLGTVLLVSMLTRSLRLYRKQNVALLLAVTVPWVGNGVYVLDLSPIPNLDPTPFAFLFSGTAITLGVFRFRLLDLLPIARDNVVQGMSDGAVVVDLRNRIVDINPAAERLLGYPASEAVGRSAAQLVPGWNALFEGYREAGEAHREVSLGEGPAQRRDYDLTLSPVVDRRGLYRGYVILLRDVTKPKQAEEALRESELRLRTVVANVPVVLFVLDRTGVFTFSEGKGLEALGLKPGEIVGLSVFEVYLDAPDILEYIRRALSGEAFSAVSNVAGSVFETRYSPLLDENGEVAGAIGVAMDITERKRAEEELAQRAVELARSNAELEQFAYSISHDLRAPLRSIDGFSQILLEDYADEFDEEGRDYLRRVRVGAQRMGQLIDDLLNLSRLNRGELRRERVDLSAIARSIAEDLRRKQPGRQVEFLISDGLVASGEARLLKVALENLLNNTWKFTGKEAHAKIEFGSIPHNETSAYFVRDNGAGFDEAYSDKLFAPFQRLHRVDEFEGNGIGLATVQRIVHRHGGRIWAEGAPGKGATFYFTL